MRLKMMSALFAVRRTWENWKRRANAKETEYVIRENSKMNKANKGATETETTNEQKRCF